MTQSAQPVGEVVESSTPQFTVACYGLYQAPDFGALVKATTRGRNVWVYGVIYDVMTGSEPPGAVVTVRGRADLRNEDIYQAYPDLSEIMRTRFAALTVGFSDGDAVRQFLPPQPPALHYAVYACDEAEVCSFTERLDYLRTILVNRQIPSDDLAAASVRQAYACRQNDPLFRERAGRQLALLLKEEYDRLRAVLARLGA
jgi:hypothetical protein